MTWSHAGLAALVLALAGQPAHAQGADNPHGPSIGACSGCHRADGWKPAVIASTFRHAEGRFPLDGAHQRTECVSCHKSLVFSTVTSSCASCHTDVHKSEFGTTCDRCHTTRSFVDVARMARAHELTRFPLRGAHVGVSCEGCHTGSVPGQGQYRGRPTTCVGCHAGTFRSATSPDHQGAGFSQDCASCHDVSTWHSAKYDHNLTQFALAGAHRAVNCAGCHADRVFKGKPMACMSCHAPDYNKTAAPPHAASAFPTLCTTCHGVQAWKGATFDHSTTQFPLTGAHGLALCSGCHADNVFKGKSSVCQSCHQKDFAASQRPPHSQLGFTSACADCHTTAAWKGAPYDHSVTRFPLTGAHRTATCNDCHANGVFRGRVSTCVSCHQGVFDKSVNPPHVASGFPVTCQLCHSTTAWKGGSFSHDVTLFPLTGAHRAASCAGCHGDNIFKGKTTSCQSCHQKNFDASARPPHSALGFSSACASCHTTTAWMGGTFDHTLTQFPLTGAHKAATCASCHGDAVYRGKTKECSGCHQSNFTATKNPPHSAAGFPATCASCHSTTAWTPSSFDHNATKFPLAGAHKAALCISCHSDGVYKGKNTACVSCHQASFTNSKMPPHSQLGFSSVCSTCHGVTTWSGGTFDHNATQFPLTGGHKAAVCASCHSDGVFKGKSTVCASCHQGNYNATKNPPHTAAGFGTSCASCHTTSGWSPATFDHNATQFPLVGAHRTAACGRCHSDGVYKGKPTACVSCHQANYTNTKNPPHAQIGYSTVCSTCHTANAWTPSTFDHNATQFPLSGAHRAVLCSGCHADGVYKGKPTACVACHQAKYSATKSPPHAQVGYSTACASCHSTNAWTPSTFDHGLTQFPLTGAHKAALCASCHADGVYKGKPTACVSCHQKDYTASKLPPHSQLGYPTACASCHGTASWKGASFDHGTTAFPLTGAHRAAVCTDCHGDGVYRGKTKDCVGCHEAKYSATKNPPHAAAGFGTTCATCHTTTAWTPATFSHSTTRFPLTGAHARTPCSSCHGDGVYRGKTMVCVGCHQAKYDATTNPNHKAASFPTDCASCHTTTTWSGATFNHDGSFFPIYSGKHKGRWSVCADCHTVPTNFKSFVCTTCHLKNKMDSAHQGRSGYKYDSPTCYSCHPRGTT